LAVAIAESCFSNLHRPAIGAEIEVPSQMEVCRDLFGDYTSRIILTTSEPGQVRKRAEASGLRCFQLGVVGGSRLIMNYEGTRAIDTAIVELEADWRAGLTALL
jgi:phosphoribosylformylglycinamidine (FGAM) synthase-like enzyme